MNSKKEAFHITEAPFDKSYILDSLGL